MTDPFTTEIAKQTVALAFSSGGKVAGYLWKKFTQRDAKRLQADPEALEAAVRALLDKDPEAARELRDLLDRELALQGTRPWIVPGTPYFVDRAGPWRELGGTGVRVVWGLSGIGKTTLAEHYAAGSAGAFSDGTLLIDLAEFRSPGGSVRRSEVRAAVLRAFGLPSSMISTVAAELMAQYDNFLAPRRVLLVFDSVESAEDLHRLLPAAPMSLVLALTDAPVEELDRYPHVQLGQLEEHADRQLLEVICGADVVQADPVGMGELLAQCDRFPGAVVAAAHAVRMRAALSKWPMRLLAGELRAGGSLGGVSAGFDRVLAELSEAERELCRRLAVYPGPGLPLDAVAALAGLTVTEVTPLVVRLRSVHFVTTEPGERMRLGNQARQAVIRAGLSTVDDDVFAGLVRFYRDRAVRADWTKSADRLRLYEPLRGEIPPWDFAVSQVDWLVAEVPVFRALAGLAHDRGLHVELTQICGALEIVGIHRGFQRELVEINHWGAQSAEAIGAVAVRVRILSQQGRLFSLLHEFERADAALSQAESLFGTLPDPDTAENRLLAASLCEFRALFCREQGKLADAARWYESALEISRALGEFGARGRALHSRMLANVLVRMGSYERAFELLTEAEACTKPEAHRDIAQIWVVRAKAMIGTGSARAAWDLLSEAWRLTVGAGSNQYDLEIAEAQGDAAWWCGDAYQARQHWSGVYERLSWARHARAAEVYAKILHGLSRH
ncbi:hypothetical protein [Amycolatopsis samaneae]|uniref:NB-ARC domain-containing protein n=1 Tax=Amycolatopsis samaneae TaxID=664691 RepID=A0ABW5GEX1_9PSEU